MSDVLSVTAAAEGRRSVRKYTDAPVSDESIREILRVAGLAPSPWNIQPWRVIVVKDHEMRQKLMAAAYNQPQVGGAPVVFVIYSDMKDALGTIEEVIHPGFGEEGKPRVKQQILGNFESMGSEKSEQWGFAESNIFLGFLLLAARAHGYGTSPMLGFDPEKVKELFNLPENATLPALVSMGVAAEDGFPHLRHSVDRFAKWV